MVVPGPEAVSIALPGPVSVLEENCEITSLVGNISWTDGAPVVHAHVTLGGQDFSVVGGHLVEGTIGVTGEIWIRAASFPIHRGPSAFRNLNLIQF